MRDGRVVLRRLPQGPPQGAAPVRVDPARQRPRAVPGDVRAARAAPAAAPRRGGDAGRARRHRAPAAAVASRSSRRGERCSGARASSRLRSTTCTASWSASPGETAGPEEETPHDAHATPPDRRRLGAPSRLVPRADVQGHHAHLRRAVGRRRVVRRRAGRDRPRAQRARRHLPRQADRDRRLDLRHLGRRRRLRPDQPGAQGQAGRLHPQRLQRARPRDHRASGSRCCATSSRRPRSSTSSCSAPRRSAVPASSCTRGTRSAAPARSPEPDVIDVDMAAILYTSGSTGKPKGVVLSHRNVLTGGASVSQYLGNRRGRRHPRRPAAQLRRRLQPAHDGLHGRRPRRARQLPAGARRGPAVRQAPGHGAHLRAAAVDPAHRAGVAGGGDPQPALLRQHRRAHAALDARQAARDLPGRQALPDVRADRGVPLHLPRPGRGRPPARLDRQGDPERRDPRRAPRRHALRPRRGGRARPPRRARGDGLLERPRPHGRALQARAGPRRRASRPPSSRCGRATS